MIILSDTSIMMHSPPHPQKRVKCFNYLGMSMSALPRAQLISFSFWLRNDWYNYNNHYMISWTKHAFWLNLINDLMEDRHVDDIIIKKRFALYHYDIKQTDSMSPWVCAVIDHRRHQNLVKSDILSYAQSATFFFLPHFEVICDLLLNRPTQTWNLIVNYTQTSSQEQSSWLLSPSIVYVFPVPVWP